MSNKKCITCQKNKNLSDYAVNTQNKDGHAGQCKICRHKYWKKYYKTHRIILLKRRFLSLGPVYDRNLWYKRKYNITYQKKEDILKTQNNQCKICHTPLTIDKAQIDHDHRRLYIRGILCHWCNIAIGMLKDNPALCDAAKLYLLTSAPVV